MKYSVSVKENLRAGEALAVLDFDKSPYEIVDLVYVEDLEKKAVLRLLASDHPCYYGQLTAPRDGKAEFIPIAFVPWETRVIVAPENYNDGTKIEYVFATRDGFIFSREVDFKEERYSEREVYCDALVYKNLMLLMPGTWYAKG